MTASPMDRIAELCVRHHLGQYAGTSVAARLDTLLTAPLDNLADTEAALLRACDFLSVTGHHLETVNTQVDQLDTHHHRHADNGTKHAPKVPA